MSLTGHKSISSPGYAYSALTGSPDDGNSAPSTAYGIAAGVTTGKDAGYTGATVTYPGNPSIAYVNARKSCDAGTAYYNYPGNEDAGDAD